jgi:RNA 2',3'-cyclic 3'-phosphodiesterase
MRRGLVPVLRQLAGLDPGIRPVRADGLHITLRFLGRVDPASETPIHDLAAQVALDTKSFRVSLEGLGAFPGRSRPRVLWAGVGQGRRELGQLAESLGPGLAAQGWSPARGPFRAHCTLARLPERLSPTSATALADFCDRGLEPAELSAAVDFVALLESLPAPQGSNRYPCRARWRLGLAEPAHHSKGRPYHWWSSG